ncbi:MAG: hypothetical protein AAF431_12885 [Pseudomonadota bacterium]
MKLINSVLPNFVKSLALVFLSAISLSAFAAHHGDAEEKAEATTEMASEEMSMEAKDGEEAASELTEEEMKMKKKKHKAKMKMKEAETEAPE